MSRLWSTLVTLLAVIALLEVQGNQKYKYPWYFSGILLQNYGPAWDVDSRKLYPNTEPKRIPNPEYKSRSLTILSWWLTENQPVFPIPES